jgi:putative nucleotidyltransferase with HDIG domain
MFIWFGNGYVMFRYPPFCFRRSESNGKWHGFQGSVKKPLTISELLKNFKNLPSLPQILLRLIDALNDEAVSLETVSRIISKDPSLCAKVMRLAHSPFVGMGNRIKTIDQAVIYLGIDVIKNLAISASVIQVFRRPEYRSLVELNQFWFHSFTCAVIARKIARKIAYGYPEEAFLCGLLHDIGKLILVVNFPKEFSSLVPSPITPLTYPANAEETIGISHSQAGAYIIESWKLKTLMADAVLYHHEALKKIEEAFPLVKIVYSANLLFHAGHGASHPEGFAPLGVLLDLSPVECDEILLSARSEVMDVAQSFEIDISPYIQAPESGVASEPLNTRDSIHDRLIDRVESISMMNGTLQSLLTADSLSSILKVVEKGASILFDVAEVCFFLLDVEKNILIGTAAPEGDGKKEAVNGLVIKADSQSAIARALIQQKMTDTFDADLSGELSIIDEQLIRLIGEEGLFCVPMLAGKEPVGVMVMGVSEELKNSLLSLSRKVTMLVNQAAIALRMEREKEARIRIIKSERLDASAQTARKVIHEVNNPLGIIKNYIKILGLKLPEKHPAQDELKIISEEIDRVKLIMMNLSQFSKPAVGSPELLDVNEMLAGFLSVIEKSMMMLSGVELRFIPDETLPKIFSVKNNIKQALLNLVKNSVEAMGEGGRISISTRALNAAGKPISGEAAEDAESVEIRVQDNGPGLPDPIKTHIFEPFYSTKEGEHAGLGLAIANSTIHEIGGGITWSSDKKSGARFSIILPVSVRPRK